MVSIRSVIDLKYSYVMKIERLEKQCEGETRVQRIIGQY